MYIVSTENTKKHTKVDMHPKISIFLMFEKKLPLCMLKPEANTMGGRHTKKKVLSLNFNKCDISE